jgi:hypothetical protein
VTIEKGYFGMAPVQPSRDEVVCISLGGGIPAILQPIAQHWEFISECYVHGIMYGEAMDDLENGLYTLQDFELHK